MHEQCMSDAQAQRLKPAVACGHLSWWIGRTAVWRGASHAHACMQCIGRMEAHPLGVGISRAGVRSLLVRRLGWSRVGGTRCSLDEDVHGEVIEDDVLPLVFRSKLKPRTNGRIVQLHDGYRGFSCTMLPTACGPISVVCPSLGSFGASDSRSTTRHYPDGMHAGRRGSGSMHVSMTSETSASACGP